MLKSYHIYEDFKIKVCRDLAGLRVGSPIMKGGFIDLDMTAIVEGISMGQRRRERAIRLLAVPFL